MLTFINRIANLLIPFQISISQNTLQIFLILCQLLLIMSLLELDVSHLFPLLLILPTLLYTRLQVTKQLMSTLFLILSSPQQIRKCFTSLSCFN